MRVLVRNLDRQPLFTADVDPAQRPTTLRAADASGCEAALQWDGAVDIEGYLVGCPVCGCRELFLRKDFPQWVGMAIVVVAALSAAVLFAMRQIILAGVVLVGVVVIDWLIALFTGQCLVCYRCRSEFRGMPIRRDQPRWDLSIGEKYRPIRNESLGGGVGGTGGGSKESQT